MSLNLIYLICKIRIIIMMVIAVTFIEHCHLMFINLLNLHNNPMR